MTPGTLAASLAVAAQAGQSAGAAQTGLAQENATLVPAAAEGGGEAASGEGEGEGEGEDGGATLDPDTVLLGDFGVMTGHIRCGLALCKAGDKVAAETHMTHPIEEK